MRVNHKRIKAIIKLAIVPVLLIIASGSGCNSSTTPCSTAADVNSPNCSSQIPGVSSIPVSLTITYANSYFYVTSGNLSGGTFGTTVPIYSDFLNLDQTTALQSVLLASAQFTNPSNYPVTSYNYIPYIEIVPQVGATYLYDYVKKDLNNNVIYEQNGTVPVIDGRVILPLINAEFNGQFYSTNAAIGSRFIHELSFAAQSSSQQGTLSSAIDFETSLMIPPTDFSTNYASGDLPNFSLDNRWNYYFSQTDFTPNPAMHFFTMTNNKPTPEQVPMDVKFVFQTPPVLNIDEQVFFELPFDYNTFESTNTIVPLRGSRFYAKTQTLTSNNAFNEVFKIAGNNVSLTSQTTLEVDSLPAGTPWNVDFFYNFNQNAGFASTSGRPLLTPLKPICYEFSNSTFDPIAEAAAKTAAIASGGYLSICHPEADTTVTIQPGQTNINLVDSWFNFFSYIPFDQFTSELGHMYGVKSVRFYTSGCVQVYTRLPGTTSWILSSQGDANCGQGVGAANTGWSYYNADKTFTIFDNIANYQSTNGLVPLLQTFSTSPVITDYPLFYFNGVANDTNHLY
jgi:hypothetical protein